MPQKKNPDALELVRGKTGRVLGDLVRLHTIVKGLTTGYQKDMQEDKEAVFDAADTVVGSVAIMRGVVAGLTLDEAALRRAASHEELIAAGLAVAIAREGLPFRKAHGLVGNMVAEARRTRSSLREVAARVLAREVPSVATRLDVLFAPDEAVRAKAARGGTAPEAVRVSLDAALSRLKRE